MTWDDRLNLRQQILTAARTGANKGLRDGAEHLLTTARQRTPHEEGTLERSGKVSTDEAQLKAAVSFNTPYAVAQHEDLAYRHDAGRTAKYLEIPLHTESAVLGRIVQTAVRRELGS